MNKSARILGQACGLTAEAMNYLLMTQGYLEDTGEGYILTEKGKRFGTEKYDSSGYFFTSWDDAIMNELNLRPKVLVAAEEGAKARRARNKAAREERMEATRIPQPVPQQQDPSLLGMIFGAFFGKRR